MFMAQMSETARDDGDLGGQGEHPVQVAVRDEPLPRVQVHRGGREGHLPGGCSNGAGRIRLHGGGHVSQLNRNQLSCKFPKGRNLEQQIKGPEDLMKYCFLYVQKQI